MRLDIKTKDMDLTDAIRAHIEEKLATLDAKVARFGDSVAAEVEVGRTTNHHHKGDVFRAEVRVALPGHSVYAEATGEDLYAAINEARQDADRQITDYKDRLDDAKRSPDPEDAA